MTDLDELAPGVQGYIVVTPSATYIPAIMATAPGSGDVGRYLDSLPTDRTIKVPGVLSPRLAGMLQRRGFTERLEWASEYGETVPVYVRPAAPA